MRVEASHVAGSVVDTAKSKNQRVQVESLKNDVIESSNDLELMVLDEFTNRQFFNIPSGVVIYCDKRDDSNRTYYYRDGWEVSRLQPPYFVKEKVALPEGQTFDGNKLPQNLNFKSDGNFNVCEQWAKGLTNEIKNVYKSIKGNGVVLDAQVTVDNGIYVLKWGQDSNEKTIQLSGDNFLKDGKIFGYGINEPEKWMKVVCYAVDNYDKLAKGYAVSENESYWIYEDNVSLVKDWMTELGALEVLSSSSVIWS